MRSKSTESKVGRPRAADPRTIQIQIRVTPAERDELEAAATADHRAMSQWIRLAALEMVRSARKLAIGFPAQPE